MSYDTRKKKKKAESKTLSELKAQELQHLQAVMNS